MCKMFGDGIENNYTLYFSVQYTSLQKKHFPCKYLMPPNMHTFNIIMSNKSEPFIQAVPTY